MEIKFKPTSVIKANLGCEPGGEVHAFFTNTCYKAMDEFVPMDKNDLRKNVTITNTSITYEMPYARYQYYGMREDGSHQVVNYTTPGTGPYWDKVMWSAKSSEVISAVQKKINGGSK